MQTILLLAVLTISVGATNHSHISSVTRHYRGDLYSLSGPSNIDEYFSPENDCVCGVGSSRVGPLGECQCQCDSDKPAFRVDTVTCVDDINECLLAELVSPTDIDKIPYVYIPLQGELIHPTAEISLLGLTQDDNPLVSPACVATNSHVLTKSGWKEVGNSTKFESPVKLHRDFGKTFLQWTGDEDDKNLVVGRLLLVHMLCRDSAFPEKPLFSPCVALRVAGSPGIERRMGQAVISEIPASDGGLTFYESLTLGLVLGFLFLAYIVASVIYIRFRKKKNVKSSSKFMEEGFAVPVKSTNISTLPQGSRRSKRFFQKTSLVSSEDDSDIEDMEDLSNINKGRSSENTSNDVGFTTAVVHEYEEDEDIYSVASEAEELEGRRQRMERIKQELQNGSLKRQKADEILEHGLHGKRESLKLSPMDLRISLNENRGKILTSELVQAPSAATEPQVENMTNLQSKKKLYFNPAYLNMDQLQNPSPDALDFIARIREMITVAKSKLKTKEFKPTLLSIPENEDFLQSRPGSSLSASRPSSTVTVRIDEPDGSIGSIDSHHSRESPEDKRGLDLRNNSTLERLSRRVDTHGETLVSELVRTLDLKPRVPDAFFLPPTYKGLISPSLASAELKMNENKKQAFGETEFPELIKPSLIKETLFHPERVSGNPEKFEDVRQEMQITLNKAKANRSMSLHVPSQVNLTRNGKTSSSVSYINAEKNKVATWLQSLEARDKSNAPESPNGARSTVGIKETVTDMVQNEVGPGLYSASIKFNSLKRPIKQPSPMSLSKTNGQPNPNLVVEETTNKLPIQSHEESVTHLINEAKTKLPKLSTVYDESHQYDSVRKSSESQSRVVEPTSHSPASSISEDGEDHAYEEIQFANSLGKHKPKKLTKEHIKEIQVVGEETDDDGRCSIYSNPESLVSEIQISNEQVVTKHSSGSVLSIEVNKSDSESDAKLSGPNENGKKRRRKVKRNDSIMQDSLERPKVKKNSPNTACNSRNETDNVAHDVSNDEANQKPILDDPKVRRSKTLRTFKDYHDMKFFRASNPSLTLAGPGINLNFHESNLKNNDRPPLPPKLLKSIEDLQSCPVESNCQNVIDPEETAPTIPPKFKLMKSKSFTEPSFLHYHVSDIPLLPPKTKGKAPETFPELPPKMKKLGFNSEEEPLPKLPDKKTSSQKESWTEKTNHFTYLSQIDSGKQLLKLSEKLDPSTVCSTHNSNRIGDDPISIAGNSSKESKKVVDPSEKENMISYREDPIPHQGHHSERVRGEFILSNNKTTSLHRTKSLPRDDSLLSAIQKIVAELGSSTETSGSFLENKIKGDLEKHFKEKSDADNIKRTWAFIMDKLDSSDKKLSVEDLQRHLSLLNKSDSDLKYKQEDSGYQSTDSCDSNNLIHNKLRRSQTSKSPKSGANSSSESSRSRTSKKPPIFSQKSSKPNSSKVDVESRVIALKKNSSNSVLHPKSGSSKLSVYIDDEL